MGLIAAAVAAVAVTAGQAAPKPHLIFMLTDDLGYSAPGYRNSDLITPSLDALASEGIILEEYYVYRFCAPTRGSFHTGRYPFHLDAVEKNLIPWSMPAGIDLRYKFLPSILKDAGYSTHHIGKWHQGFFTKAYTPLERGYDTTYGFLVGGEDHYSQDANRGGPCTEKNVDLSRNGVPCFGENGTSDGLWSGDDARYNGFRFTDAAVEIIMNWTATDPPMFMYYAVHNTHSPTQAPERIQAQYSHIPWPLQQVFDAMVTTVDETAKNVTDALKTKGMWDNTLFIWCTDNGSPVAIAGTNDPLKGGKGSNWEGGTRVPAFVAGGFLPPAQRGKTFPLGMIHIMDWYATFAGLAGANVSSDASIAPTPLESIDMWPWLSGAVRTSPRNETVYDHRMVKNGSSVGNAVGALRIGKWKLVVGPESQAMWYGHFSPNSTCGSNKTAPCHPSLSYTECANTPCLFDVVDDKTEHVNCAGDHKTGVMSILLARWEELANEYHPPPNPPTQDKAYCDFVAQNHGFVAPWLPEEK